jgi:hypothetical protein
MASSFGWTFIDDTTRVLVDASPLQIDLLDWPGAGLGKLTLKMLGG